MINNALFRPALLKNNRTKFNPDGFDLAATLVVREEKKTKAKEPIRELPPQPTEVSDKYLNAFADVEAVELVNPRSRDNADVVIRAAYIQVFGNAHVMDSERSAYAESQLRNGSISVLEFIRVLAKSDRYRTLFFDNCTNLRAIELNFKHLLGRAPENSAEISEHIQILAEEGYEAEIDSYLDSDEYYQNFGSAFVPYYRGYASQTGKTLTSYTHSYQMLRGASSSDKSVEDPASPQLQSAVLSNQATAISPLSSVPDSVPLTTPVKSVDLDAEFQDLDLTTLGYNPERFAGSSQSAQASTSVSPTTWLQQYQAREASAAFPAARKSQPVKLYSGAGTGEVDIVIRAAYKQVFGNVHLMESQRSLTAESQLTQGNITVREFIGQLAQSEHYRSLFFDDCTNARAVELNIKHFLGRAPNDFQEVAAHLAILEQEGLAAELKSYFDSEEYLQNFGDDTVPYYVGYSSQTGKNVAGYNRLFDLMSGASGSDRTVGATMKGSQRTILTKALLATPKINVPIPFNSTDFELAKTIKSTVVELECDSRIPSISDPYTKAFAGIAPLEYIPGCSAEEASIVVEAVYKQVFGNAYLMESERSPQLESAFTSGQISVRDFVRALAQSDRYRALFLEKGNNVKAVELNFKHLLGRAPENYAEISAHVQLIVEHGYTAEINSYLDSDEYIENFGSYIVPYFRGYETQTGQSMTGYTHAYQVMRGASASDKSISRGAYAELDQALLGDRQNEIKDISGLSVNQGEVTTFDLYFAGDSADQPPAVDPIIPVEDTGIQFRAYTGESSYKATIYRGMSAEQRASIWENQANTIAKTEPVTLSPNSTAQEADFVISAIYKQVLGNVHLMESERLTTLESKLKNNEITVREFVNALAKSDLYQSLFISSSPRYRAHELNFLHLLGRAPADYSETVAHSNTLDNESYAADIDSYTNSAEYLEVFGENTVPYCRGFKSQTGQQLLGYTNMFELYDSNSASTRSTATRNQPKLQKQLMANDPAGNPTVYDVRALLRRVLAEK
ncbi:Phycobilisome linker polypeptide [[Leptolyngbya] sp. PCC 7376]|uniref:phycobilisome rod-core linker polypeptide n=1 Tax=[Leptolyngbya] sp. PCC 7376 TaxID=111781 RepID=UPI00029ECE20|nr:phycobilisome rod-core linker polypeptide [[Leptolyngbya] sp. PCC 7376]AFY37060.1 Phycobilisome linker polypeptide [[Leptolyngbya] sp. PCC 7376]